MKQDKCYGEFLCANCGRVIKKSFTIPQVETAEELEKFYDSLGVQCDCGLFVQQYIPVVMRDALLALAAKGYKISLINTRTVGIVFNHKLTEDELNALPELPYEFSYDMTEPEGDIMMNARIAAMDFEGLDEEEYYKQAIENFTDWCRQLPAISDGEYIDLTKEEEYNDISE